MSSLSLFEKRRRILYRSLRPKSSTISMLPSKAWHLRRWTRHKSQSLRLGRSSKPSWMVPKRQLRSWIGSLSNSWLYRLTRWLNSHQSRHPRISSSQLTSERSHARIRWHWWLTLLIQLSRFTQWQCLRKDKRCQMPSLSIMLRMWYCSTTSPIQTLTILLIIELKLFVREKKYVWQSLSKKLLQSLEVISKL